MWQLRALTAKLLPELRPWDYWRLTPAELSEHLHGAIWRTDRDMERLAWAVAHVVNISGKSVRSPVTVDKLLGRRGAEQRDPAADFETLWSRHVERLRAQGLEPPEE